ncbi:MAG TPA: alpha-amylase family glycosyl hydrolase [Anaerolineae bacterium]|nr:alpha-amylase family glycosyl hydrolase [Anaerolineae bacterium]
MNRQAELSLARILPRLKDRFAGDRVVWAPFQARLEANFETLFDLLLHLYSGQYDFFYHLETIVETAARMWLDRPAELKALDAEREANPLWFQAQEMLGGVLYVDLFAGTLAGVRAKIPYLKEVRLTYLHLMPLFLSPKGENDGGYAVSSYREVNPALGTMEELANLASELRRNGISLALDLVYNHTSDEHEWAQRALAGDPDYQEYYLMFPDRRMPDAYDADLREIFPEVRRGSFTYRAEIDRWVWTTFHSFQWDLNYRNPVVFDRMVEEMLALANRGVEVLRLDAVAFTWKKLGTLCENLPEAHMLIQAMNALARMAAPSLLFKSEAIVHPDAVARYIGPGECQLSYNPTLMALLWESLATREVRLLRHSMQKRFKINPQCAWVNYVRVHDDIGWTFSDEDAAELGIRGYDHRQFLNAFYTGRFAGSFARGLPFQFNPATGDTRISGTCASLAGLEKALREETQAEVELAIRRILLIHSVILTIVGIPLLYLGDEVGTLNDYGYRTDPAKADDSRWAHRPATNWERVERRNDEETIEGQVYTRLRRLIEVRKDNAAFGLGETEILDTGNPHVLGFVRQHEGQRIVVLANFSEQEQRIGANELRLHGLSYGFTELVTGTEVMADEDLALEPLEVAWLKAK